MTPLPSLLNRLFHANLFGGMKLSLSHMTHLSELLGNPEKTYKTVHIAGTNGKGSTSTKIAKGLEAAGFRVGLFTSPHISCFRERMQINGKLISEVELVKHLETVFSLQDQEKISATFFELTTLAAFLHFKTEQVDYAVIETGLGGRLDATNIIIPEISIITTIGLDHVEVLGTTLDEIALEKAGIIKSHIPVVIGPTVPIEVIKPIAQHNRAPLIQVEGNFETYEIENNAISLKAMQLLNLPKNAIKLGLASLPPCRMQFLKRSSGKHPIILDVAHNPDGIKKLFQSVKKSFPNVPLHLVVGFSKSKDVQACLEIIHREAEKIYLVQASNGRGIPIKELKQTLVKKNFPEKKIFSHDAISQAVSSALNNQGESLILIFGTFFIMSEVRRFLGIIEPTDLIDFNERKMSHS